MNVYPSMGVRLRAFMRSEPSMRFIFISSGKFSKYVNSATALPGCEKRSPDFSWNRRLGLVRLVVSLGQFSFMCVALSGDVI